MVTQINAFTVLYEPFTSFKMQDSPVSSEVLPFQSKATLKEIASTDSKADISSHISVETSVWQSRFLSRSSRRR